MTASLGPAGHREAAPDDARSLLIVLTPQGRALAEDASLEDMVFESEVLAVLDKGELLALEGLLRKLGALLRAGERIA